MAKSTQPVILTIGHTDILLPDSSGVESIMKALARGVHCRDMTYREPSFLEAGDPIEVRLKFVKRGTDIRVIGDPLRLEAR